MSFSSDKSTYCKQCAKNKGYPLGYPIELNQKRRVYIVKNTSPCSNVTDTNKPGILERWKPFVYDSFNRIGNLTVIRLNKKIDKLIGGHAKDVEMLSETDGYVSLRISWNVYNQRDPKLGLPFFGSKAYYLCLGGNSDINIKVFDKPSINIVKPYIPEYHSFGHLPDIEPGEAREIVSKEMGELWNDWMTGIHAHLPKFSLENLTVNNSEFVGTTKFPISAWLTINLKNLDVVLYSAQDVLKNVGMTTKRDTTVVKHNYVAFVGELKEEVFDNIMKMNEEMGFKSSQCMKYKRIYSSVFIGKIGVRDVGPPPAPPANPAKASKRIKPKEISYESKNVKTNVKDVDLPIAMKYRNYRNMPKKVEVAPSRIHKNGLFATDE